ncbi:GNAT family N-acetyltransferase [Allonocardiopsis opalescens]|uniref:Putative acetyltransferase n=1 Tax=Allonocardiopsis opalescens TaxID=1144618 RepID=A0A2T0QE53_9ACTN|nr:GNAT family N-acetyltransferase [Allonocardiopsis opalescens]PRY02217.1 putative acetyltransferase [Allonocardiopsis opalescens]
MRESEQSGQAGPDPQVTVVEAGPERRATVERLAQLERHDLSEFRGHTPGADGLFAFDALPLFFTEPGRQAYLVHAGSHLAGFALTRPLPDGATSIFAFFVVRALRRRGVGRLAALELIQRCRPGAWRIAFQEDNPGAARFWRRIATECVGTAWSEEVLPGRGPSPDVWIRLDTRVVERTGTAP